MSSPYIHPYPDYVVESIEDQMHETYGVRGIPVTVEEVLEWLWQAQRIDTLEQLHHATTTPPRRQATMNNHPLTEQLLNLVEKHQDAAGYPDWKSLEPEFDQTVRSATAAFWQDGHDTALINGQSENPYEQEPR